MDLQNTRKTCLALAIALTSLPACKVAELPPLNESAAEDSAGEEAGTTTPTDSDDTVTPDVTTESTDDAAGDAERLMS